MAARRLLALLVAVLCIVGWVGVESNGTRANEVTAFAGPGVVCRTSTEVDMQPSGPAAPDGVIGWTGAAAPSTCVAVEAPALASTGAAPMRSRRGDPGAPRGPPLLVVS